MPRTKIQSGSCWKRSTGQVGVNPNRNYSEATQAMSSCSRGQCDRATPQFPQVPTLPALIGSSVLSGS